MKCRGCLEEARIRLTGKSAALKVSVTRLWPQLSCCVSLGESLPFSGSFTVHKQKIQTRELKFLLVCDELKILCAFQLKGERRTNIKFQVGGLG